MRERFIISSENQAKRFASDVPPLKIFDFIEHEKLVSKKINKSAQIVARLEEFDPNSKNVKNFNDELRL